MKNGLLLTLVLLLVAHLGFAQKQEWAVGLRAGEPTGLNIKKYLSGGNAIELNLGRNGWGYYRGRNYWRGEFRNSIVLGINYLWQKSTKTKGLDLYYGFGGQLSSRRYWNRDEEEERDAVGLGLTGVFGLEYFIPDVPISIFVDFGPYLELVPATAWINIDAAIGFRVNF